jgi:hypothetical protein
MEQKYEKYEKYEKNIKLQHPYFIFLRRRDKKLI